MKNFCEEICKKWISSASTVTHMIDGNLNRKMLINLEMLAVPFSTAQVYDLPERRAILLSCNSKIEDSLI